MRSGQLRFNLAACLCFCDAARCVTCLTSVGHGKQVTFGRQTIAGEFLHMKIIQVASVAVGAILTMAAFTSGEAIAETFDWHANGPGRGPRRRSSARTRRSHGDAGRQRRLYAEFDFRRGGRLHDHRADVVLWKRQHPLPRRPDRHQHQRHRLHDGGSDRQHLQLLFARKFAVRERLRRVCVGRRLRRRNFTLAVPEPSTWALTLVGFAALELAVRAKVSRQAPAT